MDILLRVLITAMCCIAGGSYAQGWNWAQAALSSGSEAATGVAIRPTNGDVLTCGTFNQAISNLPGNPSPNIIGVNNGLITLHDSGGVYLAHTIIRSDAPVVLNGIATDAQGNVYITGSFGGAADFRGNAGTPMSVSTSRNNSLFVAMFDATLRGVWVKADTLAASSVGRAIEVYYNQVFVTGSYQGDLQIDAAQLPTSNDTDALAIRIDAVTSAVMWMQEISGVGVEVGDAIAVGFGQVYLGGYFTSDTVPYGNQGAYLLNQNAGSSDIFVVTMDADSGMAGWARSAGGMAEETCHGLALDYGKVYATGNFIATATFGTASLSAMGSTDAYLWAIDRNTGSTAWAAKEGGTGMDFGEAIDVDEIGNVYWVGEYSGSVMINGSVPLTASGTNGIFCTSYRANGTPQNWAIDAGNTDYSWGYDIEAGQFGIFIAGGYQTAQLDFQAAPAISLAPGGFSNYYTAAIQCGDLLPVPPAIATSSDSLCVGNSFDVQMFNSPIGIRYGLFDAMADTLVGSMQAGNGGLLNFSSGPLAYSMDFNLVAIDPNGRCQQTLGNYFVQVSSYPVLSLGPDTLFCNGDSVQLWGQGGAYSAISWSTGATTDSIYITTSGTYWLDVKNSFSCPSSDTIVVQELVLPSLQFPDTAACVGSALTAYNPFPAYTFLWSDGTTGDSATFVPGGTVWGELSQSICTERDSFVIALLSPPYVNLGADTVLCLGANLVLDPTDDLGTYQWASGQTDTTLMVITGGSYAVSVTGPNGCVGVDQIDVTYAAGTNLFVGTTQTSFCISDPALVLVPSPAGGILSGDVSGTTIDPAQLTPGNHQVAYTYTSPAGCTDSVSLAFLVAPGPTPAQAGADLTAFAGTAVQLAANTPQVGAGTWSSLSSATFDDPSLSNASVSGLPSGTFDLIWTIATPFCGSSSDTVSLTLNPMVALMIPTGFSPNGDGSNDTWDVAGLELYAQRQLKVFNRWGAAVYENAAWSNAWDARNDGGAELPDDTYYYVLDLGSAQHAGYLVIKR